MKEKAKLVKEKRTGENCPYGCGDPSCMVNLSSTLAYSKKENKSDEKQRSKSR